MFPGNQQLATICIGVSSLLVSTLNMTGTYFGWSRRAEGHRLSSIHYAKLYRFCLIEMKLPREERKTPHDLLKFVKDQIDNLAEVSPMLPPQVIAEFKKQFDNEKYKEVSKPEEANGLEKITIYRRADEEEEEVARLGKPVSATPTPKVYSNSFTVTNPLHSQKKEEKPFVPTLKAVSEAAQSASLPDVPEELTRSPSPTKESPSS
jgi:hypothetical protein